MGSEGFRCFGSRKQSDRGVAIETKVRPPCRVDRRPRDRTWRWGEVPVTGAGDRSFPASWWRDWKRAVSRDSPWQRCWREGRWDFNTAALLLAFRGKHTKRQGKEGKKGEFRTDKGPSDINTVYVEYNYSGDPECGHGTR